MSFGDHKHQSASVIVALWYLWWKAFEFGDSSLCLLFELCAMTPKTTMWVLQLIEMSKPRCVQHCTANVRISRGKVKDEGHVGCDMYITLCFKQKGSDLSMVLSSHLWQYRGHTSTGPLWGTLMQKCLSLWIRKDLRVKICDAASPEHFPYTAQVWNLKLLLMKSANVSWINNEWCHSPAVN